ncbi:hypothetical protein [Streptomyces hyaluromycini]|uniref:hypothetical protein n=1 Tax=Streptomyces hyaluromycini TaxID=1377993 RepID=UPI0012380965|nr:hypothetical protein [Streptomyces hyaluromycini]
MPSATSPADTMVQRLLCCICGQSTADADDYVLLGISAPGIPTEQWLAAHAEHLNSTLARGFSVDSTSHSGAASPAALPVPAPESVPCPGADGFAVCRGRTHATVLGSHLARFRKINVSKS